MPAFGRVQPILYWGMPSAFGSHVTLSGWDAQHGAARCPRGENKHFWAGEQGLAQQVQEEGLQQLCDTCRNTESHLESPSGF